MYKQLMILLVIDLDDGGEDEDIVVVTTRNERIKEKEVIVQKSFCHFSFRFLWIILQVVYLLPQYKPILHKINLICNSCCSVDLLFNVCFRCRMLLIVYMQFSHINPLINQISFAEDLEKSDRLEKSIRQR